MILSGPFGLLGFSTATMLLNLVHAGEFSFGTMNIAMGFSLGMLMQFCGSILAYLRGEFFSCFVFAAYAFFWLSFGMTLMLPHDRLAGRWKAAASLLCIVPDSSAAPARDC